MVLAATIGFLVVAPGAVSIVIAVGVMGLLYGAIAPATASMIGLESPAEVQSTVFGLNASSVALGFAIGPLIGGGVAAGSGVPTAMAVTAGVGVFLALLLALGAREPAR
jgi:MFS family permease